MGLFASKPKSPYNILGLSPLSTKKQAHSKYIFLLRKSNSSSLQDIITAYDCINKLPPDFSLYSEDVLNQEEYAIDLFEKIIDYENNFKSNLNLNPPFRSPEFYKKFINFNSKRKFKNEEEKSLFNFKVRKIIRQVNILYGDNNKVEKINHNKVDKKNITNNKIEIIKEKQFNCKHCFKGFRSSNQLINHLKSKKHFLKIEGIEEDPKEFIKKEIERVGDKCESKVADKCESKIADKYESKIENCLNPYIESKLSTSSNRLKKEPTVFRTCSRCSKVFETRTIMVEHIKRDH